MIVIYTPDHKGHAPVHEIYRGERVPSFEKPDRLVIIYDALKDRGHEIINPTADSLAIIEEVHSARYINFLKTAWDTWVSIDPENEHIQPFPSVWPVRTLRSDNEPLNFIAQLGLYSMDNGTPIDRGTWTAAKAAGDAVITGAQMLHNGVHSVFCAVRPPGHHAGYDYMGGYCFINNAAIAARKLQQSGCKRVCIFDIDFHHGNGTQDIFYESPDVLYVSIHGDPKTEFPFFSGYSDEKGLGDGYGYNLNIPLAAGTTSHQWFEAFRSAISFITRYKPDAVVVSLGLDTFEGDPISKFSLLSEDFIKIGRDLHTMNTPTIFVLEGGYAVKELGTNVTNVIDGFENH